MFLDMQHRAVAGDLKLAKWNLEQARVPQQFVAGLSPDAAVATVTAHFTLFDQTEGNAHVYRVARLDTCIADSRISETYSFHRKCFPLISKGGLEDLNCNKKSENLPLSYYITLYI